MANQAMIVTAQPEASEAGARVLMAGGNAVDAAMAAALVQGVVDPQMCGIAGFGSCQIFLPGRDIHTCIDFHGKTPLAATPEMWADRIVGEARDGFGFVLKDHVNDLGYQAVTTPGSLLAYFEAVRDFGTWDWADICAPAVKQAEKGFAVRPHVHFFWTQDPEMGRAPVSERLALSATGRAIYLRPDGTPKKIGERVENLDLARTLARIAKEGAEVFYRGEIAERIDADMKANGGLLRAEDLAAYRTTRTDPLLGSYRGHDIATNQPPGGGIMLVEMLNILENFDLAGIGHNTTEYIRTVAEAMKAATADKDAHVGDPAFIDIPDHLTAKDYAAGLARRIGAGERMRVTRLGLPEPADTTHVAVIDGQGNCVTMTHSLGMPSGVITDGLGFMYNGCMAVFDPRPGRAGSIAPAKSRFSSVCPTIVMRDGAPRILIGAPGGTQIAMGVLQALLNVIDFDMSMLEAVSAPRFSATSDAIDITNRIPDYTVEPLRADGYEVIRSALNFGIGAVHGIRIDGGKLSGGADPGHDGLALSVQI
ncbi:Gamma-glutamyltranspeptidase @ Glutathione hydrolase [hydrothermal vent metagenome]|uniref:Gamma-glutamyltranspeptidase @ Glutathione hydrolase n=1 Tax=hydrothermal vent metagenome TaxID=652676 RepID=A0A3B0TB89_9ZZZZ